MYVVIYFVWKKKQLKIRTYWMAAQKGRNWKD